MTSALTFVISVTGIYLLVYTKLPQLDHFVKTNQILLSLYPKVTWCRPTKGRVYYNIMGSVVPLEFE